MNKPSKEAVKSAIEILSKQMNFHMNLAKHPQDDPLINKGRKPEISGLVEISEYHKLRWERIKSVIDYLLLSVEEVSKPAFPADTVQKGEG
jgi:hypothetical protein